MSQALADPALAGVPAASDVPATADKVTPVVDDTNMGEEDELDEAAVEAAHDGVVPADDELVANDDVTEVGEIDTEPEALFADDSDLNAGDMMGAPAGQAPVVLPTNLPTFPRSGTILAGWTTVASSALPSSLSSKVKVFDLDNDTFNIVAESRKLPHPVVTFQGKKAVKAHFEKGSVALKTAGVPPGGASFYTRGPKAAGFTFPSVKAKEISFGYSLFFSSGFGFRHGGKLPGLYGGVSESKAMGASGGHQSEEAFSARFMWRDEGKGELYCYLPREQPLNFCGASTKGKCPGKQPDGVTYGMTIGTGLWKFEPGKWNQVRQVLRLNDPSKRNGSIKVYVNGAANPVFTVNDITFGKSAATRFWGVQVQTFFGGHDPDYWSSPKDQDVYFADFTCIVSDKISG